ncbi:MAG: Hpt domain-containing protein [Proteobacteria bacterium]|nr:Hpt domain-containing protein [Pseudomonadota bacterium]
MKANLNWSRSQRSPAFLGAALVLFALAVLLPGFRLAGRLDDATAALRLVSEQRRQAEVVANALVSVRDRLESFGYVDEPLSEVRNGVAELDGLLRTLAADPATAGTFGTSAARAVQSSEAFRADVATVERAWTDFRKALVPIAAFQGVPYADSEAAGVQLNAAGKALAQEARKAIVTARKQGPVVTAALTKVSSSLEAESTQLSSYLRLLMLAALVGAIALGVGVVYFLVAGRRQAELLADAQRQTDDILKTVKEGLFLLDSKGKIGATHSGSMARLFKRESIAGVSFDELLRPLVPEKTLQTAQRFVEVLWSERTKENLVKSINPLQEVEVSFDTGAGQETRWLEFDFHRVRSDGKLANLLVSVNDVTQRVRLARELAESREKAQSQVDTLLGVLHINPRQLRSFLSDSDAAMKMVNAMLREPAREESAFRRKLDSIFRQIHSIKGEAAALGLGTVETRAHEFEDALKEAREKQQLSGADFLPLVVKLDDLFTHLASIGDLVQRLGQLHQGAPAAADEEADEAPAAAPVRAVGGGGAPTPIQIQAAVDPISQTLTQLGENIGRDRGKLVRIVTEGLAEVPAGYRKAVKDITVQAVRNALVHGIEAPDFRERSGKAAVGSVKVSFQSEGPNGFRLVVEDDGAGISLRRVREAAVARGILTSEDAARLESKQLLSLLFRSGFSTQEVADEDAGRGIGMNVIAELVRELNGRVGVSTGEGRYTRFTIVLPAQVAENVA